MMFLFNSKNFLILNGISILNSKHFLPIKLLKLQIRQECASALFQARRLLRSPLAWKAASAARGEATDDAERVGLYVTQGGERPRRAHGGQAARS